MTITGQSSLNKDTIDQMVRDAEAHAEDDRKRKDEAEVRNNADTLVYQTEKLLREQGEQMGEEKGKVEADLQHLKDALGESDVDAIKRATESLGTTLQTVSQRLYEQASASGATAGGAAGDDAGGQPADDDVVDAEIVDEGEQSA